MITIGNKSDSDICISPQKHAHGEQTHKAVTVFWLLHVLYKMVTLTIFSFWEPFFLFLVKKIIILNYNHVWIKPWIKDVHDIKVFN